MLDVQSLKKTFGEKNALQGVSFSLSAGTVLGFLGPNGAGKSTTMRIIAGVLEPDFGDVIVDGQSILTNRSEAQKKLGYLPEGAPLYDDLTPPRFLKFMASARGLRGEDEQNAVERAIADARISSVCGQRIGSLSKGYRRRVGLAAAILHDPSVLILDEPTDGLDPNQKQAVHSLIARISKNKAILISTHTLTEVSSMCSRAILIDQGQIVADDTPEQFKAMTDEGTLEAAFTLLTDQAEAHAK